MLAPGAPGKPFSKVGQALCGGLSRRIQSRRKFSAGDRLLQVRPTRRRFFAKQLVGALKVVWRPSELSTWGAKTRCRADRHRRGSHVRFLFFIESDPR